MGQVPQKKSYTLIGNGRLARHFSHYFDLLGLRHKKWSRRLDAGTPIPQADVTLIFISDSAIEPFINEHAELEGRRLIHGSGRLVTPLAEGIHPLMSFSNSGFYAPEIYQGFPLIAESENRALGSPLPDLPNAVFYIPRQDRARYHSLCVLSGNFTVLLWGKFFAELETRWGIPPAMAHSYLNQVSANLQQQGLGALTGPLARGDHQTIEANLHALEGDPYQNVYRAFVDAHSLAGESTSEGIRGSL